MVDQEWRRLRWVGAYLRRRKYQLVIALVLAVIATGLIWYSRSLPEAAENLTMNLGADLIGTVFLLFLLAPVIERAESRSGDSVVSSFKHADFIRKVADSRRHVQILELWTDLLQGTFKDRFLSAVEDALRHQVEVQILLLDPDARAAEQRADDLRSQTNVVENIRGNLLTLHAFRRRLPEDQRQLFEVRIYSALPPVQMYRVDEHVQVSFYPANVISWNATQYKTNPRAQLGAFVGDKFEELWEAASTRTLDQFGNLEIDTGPEQAPYHVRFVDHGPATYINGRAIVNDHVERGIRALLVRVARTSTQGERRLTGPFALLPLDEASPEYTEVQDQFREKYDRSYDLILKLVEAHE